MSNLVQRRLHDGVAVLTIDNPPVNALSPALWAAIDAAVAVAAADPAALAIVLIGAGSTFVAGADINGFKLLRTRDDVFARTGFTHALLRRLEDVPKPLVAAIAGNALGGGLELAMGCHYRVATPDASVGQPEVLLGLIPGAGGTQRLPRLVGPALAIEMCVEGKPLHAARALVAGIIDHIIDPPDGPSGGPSGGGDLAAGAIAFAKARAAAARRGVTRRSISDDEILARVMTALANEGARVLEDGFALRAGDIDVIYCHGFGFPRHRGGPMFYADTVGLPVVLRRVEAFRARLGDHWQPAPLLARLAAEGRGFHDFRTSGQPA